MKPIQFLTNRNGVYYFRRVVPISLRSILNRREIVLTLKTSDFKDDGISSSAFLFLSLAEDLKLGNSFQNY